MFSSPLSCLLLNRIRYLAAPVSGNGFIFVRIQGGFHEIRNSVSVTRLLNTASSIWHLFLSLNFFIEKNSLQYFTFPQICDVVVVARLLNASLVIPEIQSTTSSKGIRLISVSILITRFCYTKDWLTRCSLMLCSTQFKSFAYLYNEDQFMVALAEDVKVVKTLPKDLKGARRKKKIPSFKLSKSASPYFYLQKVLPVLNMHSVVELVVPDGGCLQVNTRTCNFLLCTVILFKCGCGISCVDQYFFVI